MKQKTVFFDSEGDAWLARNRRAVEGRSLPDSDPLLLEILDLPLHDSVDCLEIGCGTGSRLEWLGRNRGWRCFGLDPSKDAVAYCRERGIEASQGTADKLPFEDGQFDLVLFGFCLYLCDREDLFRIAEEANRVLRDPGWMLIMDFFSPLPRRREYHHHSGLFSYKMDYRALFDWHPGYTCLTHKVRHHEDPVYTDETDDWVAISVLRKNLGAVG